MMESLERRLINGFQLHAEAISNAARLAVDPSASMDCVYAAIDECISKSPGVDGMTTVYDAILTSAMLARKIQRVAHNKREDVAQVYFIQRSDGRVKIGYSHNPKARLSQLKQQSRCEMSILATTPGARQMENSLHERFASSRDTGEWFHPSVELMSFIDSLQNA